MREREEGEGKKEGEKGRGNDGDGRERDDESAKKYKEPDRARNLSPSHIFHVGNCAIFSNKVWLCILSFSQIEQIIIIENCFLMT